MAKSTERAKYSAFLKDGDDKLCEEEPIHCAGNCLNLTVANTKRPKIKLTLSFSSQSDNEVKSNSISDKMQISSNSNTNLLNSIVTKQSIKKQDLQLRNAGGNLHDNLKIPTSSNKKELRTCDLNSDLEYFSMVNLDSTCKFNELSQSNTKLNELPSIRIKRICPTNSNDSLNINPADFENDIFKSLLESNTRATIKTNNHYKNGDSTLIGALSSDYLVKQSRIQNSENLFVSPIISNNKKLSSQLSLTNSERQYSQFLKSSQVQKELDKVIANEDNLSNRKSSFSQILKESVNMNTYTAGSQSSGTSKRKSLEAASGSTKISKTETVATNDLQCEENKYSLIETDVNSVQYRKGIAQLFKNMERSICKFGPNYNEDQSQSNKSVTSACWPDDSFMANLTLEGLIDKTVNGSINDFIKKTLKENASKTVQPQNLANRTFVNVGAKFKSMGTFYDLPDKVMELIRLYKGIDKLYDWQHECLELSAVKERKNLIYSLPTSGGKTLVAEILILRELICRKRNVIFILPYVAIVQEKVWALSPFAVALDFLIEEYAAGKGCYPPKKRRYKNSAYIATTEKAIGLVNSLVEHGRLEELGLVVVDELHLIGDNQRGGRLEALLTKLMYLKEDIQIVGMSATIGNLSDLQQFLKAEVYTRNFRPVELIEYIKCDNDVLKVNWNMDSEDMFEISRKVDFSYSETVAKMDPDRLGGLVMEVIPKGSCLIFCSTKNSCENVTRLLAKILLPRLKEYKVKEKYQLLNALKNEAGTLCNILGLSIPFGIAYHHSGLTADERKLIEEGYRSGIICVICCTSTLATGVNLPAKRVIIRKPYIAKEFISLSRYKQMVGRAGRAGLGEFGESILICEKQDLTRVKQLFSSPMDQTLSKIHEDCGNYLRNLFLSSICLKTANTKAQLEKVANSTLLAVQQQKLHVDVKMLAKQAILKLFKYGAIELCDYKSTRTSNSCNDISLCINSSLNSASSNSSHKSGSRTKDKRSIVLKNNDKLIVSKLGSAAIKGCLDLSKAHLLYEDLQKAQESLVLIDCLHLLYLVTPYSVVDQTKLEKIHCFSILSHLGEKERKTASILGITNVCIMRLYSNQNIKGIGERVLTKFYLALMLYDLWNEIPVFEVSEKYQVNRGIVQSLMTNAASFASNVVSFCEELEEFWAFASLLKGMSKRLDHCCCRELQPLMELPAVKQGRASQLYNAGFKTLQSIAKADPAELLQAIEFMTRRLANQLIAAAKLLLLEKVETLKEEAEDIIDGVENPKLLFNSSLFIK